LEHTVLVRLIQGFKHSLFTKKVKRVTGLVINKSISPEYIFGVVRQLDHLEQRLLQPKLTATYVESLRRRYADPERLAEADQLEKLLADPDALRRIGELKEHAKSLLRE
jgi:hypothetical protein